jgi:hypothetical protein
LTEQVNQLLEPYLADTKVELASLKNGEKFSVPDLLVVDSADDGACLSIAFAREGFDDRFIRDLFFSKTVAKELELPPFTQPGVESILTTDKVVLNLYSGVVIHIQPDIPYPGGYSVFKPQIRGGEVVKIVGHAMHKVQSKPLPNSLVKLVYLRIGRDVATGGTLSSAKESLARMGSSFRPVVLDKSVDPISIACRESPSKAPKTAERR